MGAAMAKEKTLWRLILDIIQYIFGWKRKKKAEQEKKKAEQEERLHNIVTDLNEDYQNIEDKKNTKQDDKNIEGISRRLNRRF